MAIFPTDLALRATVLPTDKLLIHNITTGVTEYTTVARLLAVSETKYWSCAGTNFVGSHPDTDDITLNDLGTFTANMDGVFMRAPVSLPHGATVTSVKVSGNAAAEAEHYSLKRIRLSDLNVVDMCYEFVNTRDDSIMGAVIDNSLYIYIIIVTSIDIDDAIYGATITYTS